MVIEKYLKYLARLNLAYRRISYRSTSLNSVLTAARIKTASQPAWAEYLWHNASNLNNPLRS